MYNGQRTSSGELAEKCLSLTADLPRLRKLLQRSSSFSYKEGSGQSQRKVSFFLADISKIVFSLVAFFLLFFVDSGVVHAAGEAARVVNSDAR